MEEFYIGDEQIAIKTIIGFEILKFEEIIYIKAGRNICYLFSKRHDTPIKILINLLYLENILPENVFFRCHRSFIINKKSISQIYTKSYEFGLINGDIVPVSIANLKKFLDDNLY